MGNTNNDPMVKTSSSLSAGRIWSDMMRALIERNNWPPDPWPRPDGVVVKQVQGGGIRGGYTVYDEVFVEGHEDRIVLDMDWKRPD